MNAAITTSCFRLMGCTVLACASIATTARADEARVFGHIWPTEFRIPLGEVDHDPWTRLLKLYCDDRGNVNYGAWKAEETDLLALDRYLDSLSRAWPRLPAKKPERLAFWINAYNALMVRGVLQAYPVTRIERRAKARFGYDIWRDLQLRVGDETYGLDRIEHERLRPLGDFRVHFAICKASKGSAPLRNRAYTPQRLESQLSQQARIFFADRARFRYDLVRRRIRLSPLLKWYADDFGDAPQARIESIAPYLPTEDARRLVRSGKATISFLSFNSSLNDTRSMAARFGGSRY